MFSSQQDNQFYPPKSPYLSILQSLLDSHSNHTQIKDKIRRKMQRIQQLTYTAIVQTDAKYLQKGGLYDHDNELFFYIGKMINQKEFIFINTITQGFVSVKSNEKPQPQPQPEPPSQIIEQVQYVLNNIDLPLSLFKRNDNYWSADNPKTKQINDYLKNLKIRSSKQKDEIKKKRQSILKQKQQNQVKEREQIEKQQLAYKQTLKKRINSKLQSLKMNSEERQKSLTHSMEVMKSKGKPLYQKIESQFHQKVQLPTLEQKKKKLSQLRQIMRSVPLDQIQSHKEKYQKIKSEHQSKTIFTEKPQIKFKGHFYEQIQKMSASKFTASNLSTLTQKQLQYSRMVKQSHRPAIDPAKLEQMQNRIKLMNKRRTRKIQKQRKQKNSDDSDNSQKQQEVEEESEQEEQPSEAEPDSDDSDYVKPQKDDQYEPNQKERYKMGLNNLKVARKLASKINTDKTKPGIQTSINPPQSTKQITFTLTDNKSGQQTVDIGQKRPKFVWVSKYDQQQKKQQKIKYKNYLRQGRKQQVNASRMLKSLQRSLNQSSIRYNSASRYTARRSIDIQSQLMYHTKIQNKIRHIEQRAKNEEQLLRHQRINRTDKINKKMEIDSAVVDTIKARLHMMNKTLQK